MTRYLVDTNVVSEVLRPRPEPVVLDWLRDHGEGLWTTSIVVAEMLSGVALLPPGRRRDGLSAGVIAVLEDRFADRVLPFDGAAAAEYAVVRARSEREGRVVGDLDLMIAAVARVHGAVVATRNVRHLAAAGAEAIDPWAGSPRGA
ncbi:type II toxin-antitoxin system VapC family toxin [Isoptericola aurantiacus]|uniref:type II toxin-antitoxin system VapC family toxin n=1 Tax=Isoptericola aurantiacus TaxID=3377839 RepID=UPI00383B70ED